MANERIGMRRIKEILRLGFKEKYSMNRIAWRLNVGRAMVQDCGKIDGYSLMLYTC